MRHLIFHGQLLLDVLNLYLAQSHVHNIAKLKLEDGAYIIKNWGRLLGHIVVLQYSH